MTLPGNPNLTECIDYANAVGVAVERVHRTGELRFSHPSWPTTVRVNSRRKDSPRKLLVMLRRVLA